jgi:hypothetical protein
MQAQHDVLGPHGQCRPDPAIHSHPVWHPPSCAAQAGMGASDAAALASSSKLEETLSSFATERKSMAQQAEQLAAQVAELKQQLLHCQQERDMLRDSLDEETAALLEVGAAPTCCNQHGRLASTCRPAHRAAGAPWPCATHHVCLDSCDRQLMYMVP